MEVLVWFIAIVTAIIINILLIRWILRIDDIVFYLKKNYETLWEMNERQKKDCKNEFINNPDEKIVG